MVKFFSGILYFFSDCNFHFFLHWSSSDTLLSSDWVLGPAHSYAVCTYETRYWAQPFPMHLEHTRQLAPTIYIYIYICFNINRLRYYFPLKKLFGWFRLLILLLLLFQIYEISIERIWYHL